MIELLLPLMPEYALQIPEDPFAWIGWIVAFAGIIFVILKIEEFDYKLNRQVLTRFAVLSVLVLVLTPFFGVSIGNDQINQFAQKPINYFMFFAAVPWMAAGGLIGVLPATMLAGISGLLLAYLDTQNIFTPLIFMSIAVIFGWSVKQRFRTLPFRLLRFPVIAAFISWLLLIPILFATLLLSIPGPIDSRIIHGIQALPSVSLALAGMMLVGGIVCVVFWMIARKSWGSDKPLKPAPRETSIKYHFTVTTLAILMVVMVVVIAVNWRISENNTRRIMVDRLVSISDMVSDGLPLFFGTGEGLIAELAEDRALARGDQEVVISRLVERMEAHPYFNMLVIMDENGEVIGNFTRETSSNYILTEDEVLAIDAAFTGELLQVFAVSSQSEEVAGQISFIARVLEPSPQPNRVIWGRSDIGSNPYAQPYVNVLDDLAKKGGTGQIVGHDGKIIYHTDPNPLINSYQGSHYSTATYFEGVSQDGQAMIQYYQPIEGTRWALVTSLPKQVIQIMALRTIVPLLLTGLGAILALILVIQLGFSPIVKDINLVKSAVEKISKGMFEVNLSGRRSFGELAQLKESFQNMLNSLRSRMAKQSNLLAVSEQLTGQFNLQEQLNSIMKAAMTRGISSVRIVLVPGTDKNLLQGQANQYGMGKQNHLLASLDKEILARTRSQGPLVLRDFEIGKMLHTIKEVPSPESLISMPLKWKDMFLGVLWATFQERSSSMLEEVDFFKSLSQKALLAIVNARAFDEAITARMQFETVLDSLPDAVMITDSDGRVMYKNRPAQDLLGFNKNLSNAEQLSSVFSEDDLSELGSFGRKTAETKEVRLADGKIYRTIASPILVGGREIGRSIIIKDITSTTKRESLQTEFITTVSHELRSPLTLIHGYAKILHLTGNLNEQQNTYIGNIIDGLEEMKRLVQNLLDIGRLESSDSLEITQISARDIAQNVFDGMIAQAKQKNIQMTLSTPEEPVIIKADGTFLTQALKNLLENAIKFTKMGGEVKLFVRPQSDSVVFSVQDNGIGIAPLDQRNLFKRFQRVNTQVRDEQNGSGLGLAIVKSIAERHGGKVWLESQLGKGSTFYLQIPSH